MKLFVTVVCVAVVACNGARLDNTYLPPGSAKTAGGSGNFLGAPRPSGSGPGGAVGSGGAFGGRGGFGSGAGGTGGAGPAAGAHGAGGNYRGGAGGHSPGQDIPILRFTNENYGDGNYHFEYETGNGIQAQEAGQLRNPGTEAESIDVQGTFSYTGDDGAQYTITYTADENGFQPQGAHLPTPPPIPEAILKSLEINAAEEARNPQGAGNDGQYNAGAYQQGPSGGSGRFPGSGSGSGSGSGGRKQSFSPQSGYQY